MTKGVLIYDANPLNGVNYLFFSSKGILGGNPKKFVSSLNKALAESNSSTHIDLDISNGTPRELQDYKYILVTEHASRWVDHNDFTNSVIIPISSGDFFYSRVNNTLQQLL
ncbi:hypothetical protein [Weissella cibaria]|uniref:hypothetical protein n=1 Tax=Weissella cibaria TaxID=137591 RepID=UPI00223AF235|nr:hypothetical protein [Weissella cibaria]MCT0020009.1 hypothetical protein [Weissella cibaria]